MEMRRVYYIVITALVKILAYATLAAPTYASWGIDIENYRSFLRSKVRRNMIATVDHALPRSNGLPPDMSWILDDVG
jgi:hypothetical protein